MKAKIITRYFRQRDVDVVAIAYRIVDCMNDNAHFPNPAPALPQVQQALQDYQAALSDAASGDKAMISVKNDKKATLCNLLKELAAYVTGVSNGDKSKLLTSGFDLAKEKGESQLPPIGKIEVEIGPPGQATTIIKKINGAKAYVHQYTKDDLSDEAIWVSETTTSRRHTFNNLPSTVKHWFRIIAVGAGGQKVYSEPVSRVIQ